MKKTKNLYCIYFKEVFYDYEKSISVYKQEVKKNNKVFQSVKYMESSKVEWGS